MKAEFNKSWKSSKQPRKQRKFLANAPNHTLNSDAKRLVGSSTKLMGGSISLRLGGSQSKIVGGSATPGTCATNVTGGLY